ncbi:MAG: Zn-ribbon domain-containing OB-fold protein [Chloroflexi bacterium]|nr:Zn-ribbon domain-containing OB-fold protein [Chloroflexota bacterium]
MPKSFDDTILNIGSDAEKPHLWGSRCQKCGKAFFPQHVACVNCGSSDMAKIALARTGAIYSYTVVRHKGIKPEHWSGTFPYALGFVDFPEGARATALFIDWEPDGLAVGGQAELVTGKVGADRDGNDIIGYSFRPVK